MSATLKQIKFFTNNPSYASCNKISLHQLFTQEVTTVCRKVGTDFKKGLTIHIEKLAALGKLSRQSVVESVLADMPRRKLLFFSFVIDSLKTEDLNLKSDLLLTSLLDKFTQFSLIPSKEQIKPPLP